MPAKFAKICRRALLDDRLTDKQVRVLGVLALHAWRGSAIVYGKTSALIEEGGFEHGTFFDAIAQLKRCGYLEAGSGKELYRLIFDPASATDDSPASRTVAVRPAGPEESGQSDHEPHPESGHSDRAVRPAGPDGPPSRTGLPLNRNFNRSINRGRGNGSSASINCADDFDEPAHRDAYAAYRIAHRMPDSFDAIMRSVHDPATGGDRYDWRTIGQALLEMRGVAADFSAARLRGFCRRLVQPDPANGRPLTRQERGRAALAVTLKRHGFSNGQPADDQPISRPLSGALPDARHHRPDRGGVDDRA
jgi:hypothetical protein